MNAFIVLLPLDQVTFVPAPGIAITLIATISFHSIPAVLPLTILPAKVNPIQIVRYCQKWSLFCQRQAVGSTQEDE